MHETSYFLLKYILLWKGDITTQENLSALNACYPVEVVEYTVLQKIDHEPNFNWWSKHVLRRQDIII